MSVEERVIQVLEKPLTNREIARKTGMPHDEVGKALKNLRNNGKIVSHGKTSKRRHMRLATAIEVLIGEIIRLKKDGQLDLTRHTSW